MDITTGYRSWSDERKSAMWFKVTNVVLTVVGIACAVAIGYILFITYADKWVEALPSPKQPVAYNSNQYVHYFSRPAAFRLSTPTPEQMEHLHAIIKVEQVRKADGSVPDGMD